MEVLQRYNLIRHIIINLTLVYNYKADTYRRLFTEDTFIESFKVVGRSPYYLSGPEKTQNISSRWVFLLVKTSDTNKSGRIDERDPSILFAVTTQGDNLKQVTSEQENVVSFQVFDKLGFALLKIQKDSDHDRSFKNEDKVFYFRKINLDDLTLGNRIELN